MWKEHWPPPPEAAGVLKVVGVLVEIGVRVGSVRAFLGGAG